MNAIDRFAISYLVTEISIKELQRHATTATTTVKIVTSADLREQKVAREIKWTLVNFVCQGNIFLGPRPLSKNDSLYSSS